MFIKLNYLTERTFVFCNKSLNGFNVNSRKVRTIIIIFETEKRLKVG